MTFIGRLKQHSAICRRWRGEARTGGVLHNVHFAWEPGGVYRTLPLTSEQVTLLRSHDNVILEVVGTDLPAPTVEEPTERPVAARPAYVNSRPVGRR